MKKKWVLTQDAFETLLRWLDPDREKAGLKYEAIRSGLIKIFTCWGYSDAEDLTDETINRVSVKIVDLVDTYEGDPALYFIGVARNVRRECDRRPHLADADSILEKNANNLSQEASQIADDTELDYRCLDRCLEELPAENRRLVLEYYEHEKQGKIDHRKRLANELGIAVNALRIRAHRIRRTLQQCLQQCLEEQPAN
jgi:DNA-directed RNA polymerase specialized sigma24 family protein